MKHYKNVPKEETPVSFFVKNLTGYKLSKFTWTWKDKVYYWFRELRGCFLHYVLGGAKHVSLSLKN